MQFPIFNFLEWSQAVVVVCSLMCYYHRYRGEIPDLLYRPMPHIMSLSAMELQLGICQPHTWNQITQTTCAHDLQGTCVCYSCVLRDFSCIFVFALKSHLTQLTYAPDESHQFWFWDKLEKPTAIRAPCW